MTADEARQNIGKPFKWLGGGTYWWDIIQGVDDNGWIIGNFFSAPAEDCRLKQEQPEQLKKIKNNYENKESQFPDDRIK